MVSGEDHHHGLQHYKKKKYWRPEKRKPLNGLEPALAPSSIDSLLGSHRPILSTELTYQLKFHAVAGHDYCQVSSKAFSSLKSRGQTTFSVTRELLGEVILVCKMGRLMGFTYLYLKK
ncbi:hypothetical protein NE237_007525 [Protea cynaroides]|uniref:Uncharacterized protein n=1 Tax=Protea cynaroides TaxID=273540 RepID=A0A9Q0KPL8_9MAGN|nr:hypothetical protein NE237_007525 [Protea cynaroides]